jgi:hypothetical protein
MIANGGPNILSKITFVVFPGWSLSSVDLLIAAMPLTTGGAGTGHADTKKAAVKAGIIRHRWPDFIVRFPL